MSKKETPKHKQQLNRIKRFISRAEKKGYRFSPELKENLSSYSTQKLKSLSPKKLYQNATAISEETGKIISGTEKQRETRSLASLKARATKLSKAISSNAREEYYKTSEREESYDSASFTDIILQNIEAKINQFYDSQTAQFAYGAKLLKATLDSQIAQYGRAKVATSCENAPEEAKRLSDVVVFASKQEQKHQALIEFVMIITGEIMTLDLAKDIGDALETDSYDVDDSED